MIGVRRFFIGLMMLSITICGMTMTTASFAQDNLRVTDGKGLEFRAPTLRDWKDSTPGERKSFLVGLVTMLEVEREWQSPKALPINQSTVGLWTKGLYGVSFDDMYGSINRYIEQHPDRMNEQVVQVLGNMYIRPAMSTQDRTIARQHYMDVQKTLNHR